MFERVIHLAAVTLLASGLLTGQSDLKVHQAQLSTMFGSAAGYIAAVNGDVLFVNTEKPEMSMHIPGKSIISSSVNEGTLTLVCSAPIHGLSTFNFKLADPSAAFELAPGPTAGRGSQTASRTGVGTGSSADTGAVLQTFEVRHDHFPRGGCEGRLIVREDRIQFESMTDIGHSQMWRMSDIKEIKRKNPYKLELNPFVGSGYNFEVLRQGMSPSDFEFITKRIANSRMSRK